MCLRNWSCKLVVHVCEICLPTGILLTVLQQLFYVAAVSLSRGKSFKTRIGQYSTPMESIQANAELVNKTEDEDVP